MNLKNDNSVFNNNALSQFYLNMDLFNLQYKVENLENKLVSENIDYYKKVILNSFKDDFLFNKKNYKLLFYCIMLLFYLKEFEFFENIINENPDDKNITKIIKLYYFFFSEQFDFFIEEFSNNKIIDKESDKNEITLSKFYEFYLFINLLYNLKIENTTSIDLKDLIKLPDYFVNNISFIKKLIDKIKYFECFGTLYYLQTKVRFNIFDKDYYKLIKIANGFYKKDDLISIKSKYNLYKYDFNLLLNSSKLIKKSFFKKINTFYNIKFPYLKYIFLKKSIFVIENEEFKKTLLQSISSDPGYKYYYPLLMYYYANTKNIDKIYKLEDLYKKYFKFDKESLKMLVKTFFKISNYSKTKEYLELFEKRSKDNEFKRIHEMIKKLTKI